MDLVCSPRTSRNTNPKRSGTIVRQVFSHSSASNSRSRDRESVKCFITASVFGCGSAPYSASSRIMRSSHSPNCDGVLKSLPLVAKIAFFICPTNGGRRRMNERYSTSPSVRWKDKVFGPTRQCSGKELGTSGWRWYSATPLLPCLSRGFGNRLANNLQAAELSLTDIKFLQADVCQTNCQALSTVNVSWKVVVKARRPGTNCIE